MRDKTIIFILMLIIGIQAYGWYWQTGETLNAKQRLLDCMTESSLHSVMNRCYERDTILITNNVFYWDSTMLEVGKIMSE